MFRFPLPNRPIFLEKWKIRISCKEASTLVYKQMNLVLLTPIVLNYHRYFVFVAFLDIW